MRTMATGSYEHWHALNGLQRPISLCSRKRSIFALIDSSHLFTFIIALVLIIYGSFRYEHVPVAIPSSIH